MGLGFGTTGFLNDMGFQKLLKSTSAAIFKLDILSQDS